MQFERLASRNFSDKQFEEDGANRVVCKRRRSLRDVNNFGRAAALHFSPQKSWNFRLAERTTLQVSAGAR